MPIIEGHLKADEKLFTTVKFDSKSDFILGSLFPDCFWGDNPTKGLVPKNEDVDKLHISNWEYGIRLPNYFEFVNRYKKELLYSDFMRGVLFHLILDYVTNVTWFNRVDADGDNYVINGDACRVECQGLENLLAYKYGDMQRYIAFSPVGIAVPATISKTTLNFIADTFYDIDWNVEDMLTNVMYYLDNGYKQLQKPLFFDKYYSDIIKKSVEIFKTIGVLYSWFPLVKEEM